MSCKLDNSGAAGGAFDIVGLQRTVRAKFVDCWFLVDRENGISLRTDSSGSSCTDTVIDRCHFDVQDGGDTGVLMKDVQGARVERCDFDLAAGTAVTFSANGATSNAERVFVNDNDVLFGAASTADQAFVMDGPTTSYFKGLDVCRNHIDVGANAATHVIQVSGAMLGATVINQNTIRGSGGATSCIRVTNSASFCVNSNNIIFTGAGTIGILIGATARAGTVSACTAYTCANNVVDTPSSNYVFCHPGTGTNFGNAVVTGNSGVGATEANYEIWGLDGDPTSYTMRFTAVGNHASGAVAANWAVYQDRGSSTGGRAGNANDSWLIFRNNICAGTTIGNAAGDHFRETDTAGTRRCLTDVDDANPSLDNLR
jgi:hypothetical protein